MNAFSNASITACFSRPVFFWIVTLVLHSLPEITVEGSAFALPCPLVDLVELAHAMDGSLLENDSAERLTAVLRQSPSLLMFALHRYDQAFRLASKNEAEPPSSFPGWLQSDFVGSLVDSDASCAAVKIKGSPKWLRKVLTGFCSATKPRKLKQSLREFCGLVQIPLGKKKIHRWIDTICKKSVCRDLLRTCDAVGSVAMIKKTKSNWTRHPNQLPLSSLFGRVETAKRTIALLEADLDQRKLLAMKQLAYGASHEINNPLANISTRAQTLLADEKHPERRNKLATIYEQAMRAHEMISDLMLFAHPAKPEMGNVDLVEVAEQVVLEFRARLRQHKIHCEVKRYPEVVAVEADGTKLAVAIKAVLQNAIEALAAESQATPRIQLRIWPADESTMAMAIVDNGPGIDAETLKHIFDPFYSGREAGRGLGFGLSKAWTIVNQLHGGKLKYIPKQTGAEFQLHLPVLQSPAVSMFEPEQENHRAA